MLINSDRVVSLSRTLTTKGNDTPPIEVTCSIGALIGGGVVRLAHSERARADGITQWLSIVLLDDGATAVVEATARHTDWDYDSGPNTDVIAWSSRLHPKGSLVSVQNQFPEIREQGRPHNLTGYLVATGWELRWADTSDATVLPLLPLTFRSDTESAGVLVSALLEQLRS